MYSLNRVELIGRIGSDDFSLGRSSKEQAVLTVSVATAEKWQSEDGSEQEHTEWHRCVFFRKCAETAFQHDFLTFVVTIVDVGKGDFLEGIMQR